MGQFPLHQPSMIRSTYNNDMSGTTSHGLLPIKAVNPLYSDIPSQALYGQGGMPLFGQGGMWGSHGGMWSN